LADAGDDDFARVAQLSTIPVVVDFWVPLVRTMPGGEPRPRTVAQNLAGRVKLVKMNVDTTPALSERFRSTPSRPCWC
jgi:thioredoxin 2